MARRVFFSFHYERDVWRAGPVRNSWVTKSDREEAGFWDAAAWEEVKKKGEDAIKRWIDKYLEGMKDQYGRTDSKGKNPFVEFYIEENGRKTYLSEMYPTYDWVNDGGYYYLGDWVEKAAKNAGR